MALFFPLLGNFATIEKQTSTKGGEDRAKRNGEGRCPKQKG